MNGRGTPVSRTRSGSPATLKEKHKERDGDRDKEKEREKGKDRDRERDRNGKSAKATSNGAPPGLRTRNTPHLPHAKDIEAAPATLMYWSRAPVYGLLPQHGMRAHSATLVDNIAWLFGGCDEKGCWKDVYLFNTGASPDHV